MLSFDLNREIVGEMVAKYAVRFSLSSEEMDTLMANIERFNASPVKVGEPSTAEP